MGCRAISATARLAKNFADLGFGSKRFADGVLYVPEFDVCVEVSSTEAGATVGLTACDDSDAQSFAFSGDGTITPVTAPEMCLTLGMAACTGRSDTNQIKELTLDACSADLAAYQSWGNRTAE